MRIGIDARLSYHQSAGITRYTRHLLRALARTDHDNQYLVFQHRKHAQPLIETSNFRRSTLYTPTHSRLEQPFVALELLLHGINLLHSPDFIPPLYSPVPSVITVHDLGFLIWPHFLTKRSAAYYGQIDRAVRHAKQIIVPSRSTKADVVGQLGVPKTKVSVIYEAAGPLFRPLPLQPTLEAITKKFRIPEKYIFFVGTIEPRKNIGGLLQAFRHLQDKYGIRDTGLVLAGKPGWLYEEVFQTVESLELKDSTFFVGRVTDYDLHQLYVGARCHVLPAFYEGFGLPPLEAMACGTPTVVSNTSSLPEVVGDAGLMADPNDWEEIAIALYRLLTDDDLHAEYREKGLRRARVFTWERAAQQTLAVYRNVVEAKGVRTPEASVSSK